MVQRGPLNDTVSYLIALRTVNLTHVRNLRYASSQGQACPARREREEGKGRCRVGLTTSTCKKNIITHKPINQIKFRLHR
jgi:hypothetical protein